MRLLVRPYRICLFLLLGYTSGFACIDSLKYKTDPVQCYGLRNGRILINKVFGGAAPYFYSIDGHSFSTNPEFDHLWAGNYTLSVRDASGCVKTFAIKVTEPSELSLRLVASDTNIVAGKPLFLEGLVSPDTTTLKAIQWRPPHLFSVQASLKQQISISENTNLALEIIDANGCIARSNLSVTVDHTNIYIPNVIKLGSAQDAYFTVYAGEGVNQVLSLKIYSRIGAPVFERTNFPANDPIIGWNGKWDGQKAQTGVYLWVVDVELLDGSTEHFEGSVTVVE
jgi:CHU_C Type IX secretion signal domain